MALYTIKQGDTLFLISQRLLGNGNLYNQILNMNPQITDPNRIQAGDLLEVPDTPASIAAENEDPNDIVTDESGEGMSMNTKIILVSGVAAAAAFAWWYMGQQGMLPKSNPEESEDSDELDDSEDLEETEE